MKCSFFFASSSGRVICVTELFHFELHAQVFIGAIDSIFLSELTIKRTPFVYVHVRRIRYIEMGFGQESDCLANTDSLFYTCEKEHL